MRINAKKTLFRVVVLTFILFLAIWGTSRIVGSSKKSMAATVCNSNAKNISGSDEDRALCLQDMNDSVKDSMTEEYEHYALADSRDGNTYYIAKLADGNVWMTQNLGLGTTSSTITLDYTDTDISASSTFTTLPKAESIVDDDSINDTDYYSVHDSFIEGGNIYIQPSGSFARDIVKVQNTGSGHYRLGNGYPWTVATAQTAEYVDPSDQTGINMTPSDSICPAGWRLPSQDDYKNLLTEYGLFEEHGDTEGSEETSSALRLGPLHFIRGFPYLLGTDGNYWTSTTSKETEDHYVARVFFINGYHSGSSYRTAEISGDVAAIRCIARTDSDFSYTLSYNLNGASGSISSSTLYSSRKQVTTKVTTTVPTWDRHTFKGWATSSDATTAGYEGGDDISLSGNKTLYAVWEIIVSDQEVSFDQSSVSKTYGDSDFTNAATTTGEGTITYSSNNTGVAEVNSNTGKVTIKGAGTATITATAAATDYYYSASNTYTLTVAKATPTVSFVNTEVSKNYLDDSFVNAATASNDGTITYQSNNADVATVDGSTGEVTITGAGTATITATVAATSNYNSASTTYNLTVAKIAPTISFDNTAVVKTYGDDKFINSATTVSDGVVSYSSDNDDVATVDSSTGEVTIVGAGDAMITASVPTTTNYEAASATYTLTINKKISATPEEVSEIKEGYMNDALSTIHLNTVGLVWEDSAEIIKEGYDGYAVKYTENGDTKNYTTESFEITVLGKHRIYNVVEGDGQIYTLEDDKDGIKFGVNADSELLKGKLEVYVDGALVDAKNYIAGFDDVVTISLVNDYLETLAVGKHDLKIYFDDGGEAKASFEIEEAEKKDDEGDKEDDGDKENEGDKEDEDDKKDEDDGEDEDEEKIPVPNTGVMGGSDDNAGLSTLVCMLPGGMMAGALIGSYIWRSKKTHRKFDW